MIGLFFLVKLSPEGKHKGLADNGSNLQAINPVNNNLTLLKK